MQRGWLKIGQGRQLPAGKAISRQAEECLALASEVFCFVAS